MRRRLVRPEGGVRFCNDAPILHDDQITGTDDGEEGTMFVTLDDTGVPGGWHV